VCYFVGLGIVIKDIKKKEPFFNYKTVQPLDFFFFETINAALVACSKTSRTPSPVLAEHSRYL
jgi:hypothetical protein